MKKIVIFGIIVVCVAGLAAVAYFNAPSFQSFISEVRGAGISDESEIPAPSLGSVYTNEEFGFSLSMPADFTVAEIPSDEGGKSIVLQDAQGNGIQIFVTPYSNDTRVLTADDVRSSIPDMQVTGEQPVEIGNDYTGVAFKSDNDAFGGSSREVWFVFRGNLYQISTYARLDPLLQAMFGTWKFY